ncbi:MAG: hypothetical protein M3144_10250 [Actinomycetota bacterium]|nr:hypothetical protein [Actinomycetota bacterium]
MSSGPRPPGPFRDPDVPDELLAKWFHAEERLYPVAMVMPERYEAAVRLVGRLAEQLRASCPDLPSLVATDPEVREMAERLVSYDPLLAEDLDLDLVAGSACSIRYRELAANRGS